MTLPNVPADLVLAQVDAGVDLSRGATRLQLRGGSVTLDLGLSAELQRYIELPAELPER